MFGILQDGFFNGPNFLCSLTDGRRLRVSGTKESNLRNTKKEMKINKSW